MDAHVGTSGYSFKEWKGNFYPENLAASRMLAYYAERFDTVEINNTFYRMPSEKAVEGWRDAVPDHFRFVLKASRRITHLKRLGDVGEETAYLFEKAALLGEKLGPLLFQLPPFARKDLDRLRAFLDLVPDGRRVALEFRNDTWRDDEVHRVLRDHGAALCITDDGKEDGPSIEEAIVATADFGYLRLRDDRYDDDALERCAEAIRAQSWSELFVFFKHEDEGRGPELAARFRELFDA